MLVLSRKRYERIMIGDDVIVQVVEIRPDRVVLGFDAPREMKIHREEVWANAWVGGEKKELPPDFVL